VIIRDICQANKQAIGRYRKNDQTRRVNATYLKEYIVNKYAN